MSNAVTVCEFQPGDEAAFRRLGLLREAYVSHINAKYAGDSGEDLSVLKINEVTNWLRAWTFMEGCGLTCEEDDEDPDETDRR